MNQYSQGPETSTSPVTHGNQPIPAAGHGQLQTARNVRPFEFDGGAGSYFLVGLGSSLLMLVTLGLAAPWAVAMYYRWQTNHTIINGRRLRFTGSGGSLFGHYIKWWLLTVITAGIYSFWVVPRMVRWGVEHQDWR